MSNGKTGYYAINYDKLGVVGVKAMQELEAELSTKKEQLNELMCRMEALKEKIK